MAAVAAPAPTQGISDSHFSDKVSGSGSASPCSKNLGLLNVDCRVVDRELMMDTGEADRGQAVEHERGEGWVDYGSLNIVESD
jgi:hypothetical protein